MQHIRTRLLVATTMTAALTLATTGCGSNEEGLGVASLAGEDGTIDMLAAPGPPQEVEGIEAPTDLEEAERLYEKCMADNGVDIYEYFGNNTEEGAAGEPASATDIDNYIAADDACMPHLANADTGRIYLDPEQEAALNDLRRLQAACLEDAGFPTSMSEDGMVDIEYPADDGDLERFQTTLEDCERQIMDEHPDLAATIKDLE